MTAIWPTLVYDDARAAIEFLGTAFGFEEALVVDGPDGLVAHAELRWPGGGGVMLGSRAASREPFASLPTGATSIYVVTPEPDALFERATAAGAEVVLDLHDTDHGSRDFSVRDPEGALWSFGTYAGTPPA